MWGELVLLQDSDQGTDSKRLPTIPDVIELDVSKSVHFVGRVPNPAQNGSWHHRTQHSIPLAYLSSTHFSIALENEVSKSSPTFVITDFSTNGTFLRNSSSPSSTLIGNGNTAVIHHGDEISLKFKSASLTYKFSALEHAPLIPLNATKDGPEMETQYAVAQQQILQLQEEVARLEQRIATNLSKTEKFQSTCNSQAKEIASLKSFLSEKDDTISKLNDNLQTSNSTLAATDAFNRKLKDQIHDFKAELAEAAAKVWRQQTYTFADAWSPQQQPHAPHSIFRQHTNSFPINCTSLLLFPSPPPLIPHVRQNEALRDDLKHKEEQVVARDDMLGDANRLVREEGRARKAAEGEVKRLAALHAEALLNAQRLTAANTALQAVACDREQEATSLSVRACFPPSLTPSPLPQ